MRLKFWMAVLLILALRASVYGQTVPPLAITHDPATLYAAPGQQHQTLGTVPGRETVIIEGRSEGGHWLLIRTLDESLRGWVATSTVTLSADVFLPDLPLSTESLTEETPKTYPDDIAAKLEQLNSIPLLYNMDTEQVHSIFEAGQQLGNRADVFVKVGDSNTANGDFFRPFGMNNVQCELGTYRYLQDTINFFSGKPRSTDPNSFNTNNLTVKAGLGTAATLDPLWATDASCRADESLLACEYRITKPSVAVMMIGLMDLEHHTLEVYRANLEEIVQFSIDSGVIPVLTTYAVLEDYPVPEHTLWPKSLDLNLVTVEVAEKFGTPLIHLWKGQQSLPGLGIGPDRTHLRAVVGQFCDFEGAELEIGGTYRNLLSLQALDELRRHVLVEGNDG